MTALAVGIYLPVAGLFGFRAKPVYSEVGQVLSVVSSEEEKEIKIFFAGDIMLSRHIGEIISSRQNPNFPFEQVSGFLHNFDIVFGNLENPVSRHGQKTGTIYSFRAEPETIPGLKNAGFNLVNLANNHTWDFGPEAFSDTLKILKKEGIDFIGGGVDREAAHAPLIKNIRGTKIAFLGYTDLISPALDSPASRPAAAFLNPESMVSDIFQARQEADLVAVTFHWGDEYQTKHNLRQEEIAHLAIESGASLVIGHHPHVIQEIEGYHGGYIAYSLGNFVFDQNFSDETGRGLGLEVWVKNKRIQSVRPRIFNFNRDFQPVLAD